MTPSLRTLAWYLTLAASLSLTACGGDESTADAEGGTEEEEDNDRPGRSDGGADDDGNDQPTEDATVTPDGVTPDAGGTDTGGGGGTCTPGSVLCRSLDAVSTCNESGSGYTDAPCAGGSYCVDDSGVCVPGVCRPFTNECTGARTRSQCAPDGSAWLPGADCGEQEYCQGGACLVSACLPQVMFAFDGSSSMTGEFDNVRASINAVTAANPDVAFGLTMFPGSLGCSVGGDGTGIFGGGEPIVWPDVPIAVNGGPAIDAWFSANDASGGATPLRATIEWFAENYADVWEIPDNGHLIILTEGADTCTSSCEDGDDVCLANRLREATEQLVLRGVQVYVIGYQYAESRDLLNAIAAAGNTPFTEFIFAGNEETLTAAFETVVGNAKLCGE